MNSTIIKNSTKQILFKSDEKDLLYPPILKISLRNSTLKSKTSKEILDLEKKKKKYLLYF